VVNDKQNIEAQIAGTESQLKARDAAKKANSAVVSSAVIGTMQADDAAVQRHATDLNKSLSDSLSEPNAQK
jgi:hypothetical protein